MRLLVLGILRGTNMRRIVLNQKVVSCVLTLAGFLVASCVEANPPLKTTKISVSMTGSAANAGSPVVFTIQRSTTSNGLNVSFLTSNGTAVAGTDYDAQSLTVSFPIGVASETVSVPTHIDPSAYGKSLSFSATVYVNGNPASVASAAIVEPAAPVPVPAPSPTTISGAPMPTGGLSFGTACTGSSCTYTGAIENETVSASCLQGAMTVSNTIFGYGSYTVSCSSYAAANCNGKSTCSLVFSVANCGGMDPIVGTVKLGAMSVSCSGGSPNPNPSPSPSPMPSMSPSPAPSPTYSVTPDGIVGEFPIFDNFNTADALQVSTDVIPVGSIPPQSQDPVGSFRFICQAGQLLYDDPIALPGKPGTSHLHQFIGNTTANAFSNYTSLRTNGGSTCGGVGTEGINRSSYWMPAMLDGAGSVVKPDYVQVYYKRIPKSNPACGAPDATHVGYCTEVPNGIRFIFGYNMKTSTGGPTDTNSWDYWAMNFQCWNKDGTGNYAGAPGVYHTMADAVAAGCPLGKWLHVALDAPGCWDGVNLDTPDHRSHVVYASGPGIASIGQRECPADHPYLLPAISYQWFFTVDSNFVAGKWHLSSDEMVPGAPAGTTLHMDYFEAWSPTVKDTWEQNCLDQHLTCNLGDLGNGTQIQNACNPSTGIPNHVLVPVP